MNEPCQVELGEMKTGVFGNFSEDCLMAQCHFNNYRSEIRSSISESKSDLFSKCYKGKLVSGMKLSVNMRLGGSLVSPTFPQDPAFPLRPLPANQRIVAARGSGLPTSDAPTQGKGRGLVLLMNWLHAPQALLAFFTIVSSLKWKFPNPQTFSAS